MKGFGVGYKGLIKCYVQKQSSRGLQNLQEDNCARAYLLIKLQAEACNFIKKEALAQMFSIEFCETFSSEFSSFFCRTPLVFASIRF